MISHSDSYSFGWSLIRIVSGGLSLIRAVSRSGSLNLSRVVPHQTSLSPWCSLIKLVIDQGGLSSGDLLSDTWSLSKMAS